MKPIIFSTEMVKAILAGRKSQTRRVVKPQYATKSTGEKIPLDEFVKNESYEVLAQFAPYKAGDVLWVRETCAYFEGAAGAGYIYRADDIHDPPIELCMPDRWTPSIHMPRRAARVFLKVINVRAERLQSITDSDAIAEGIRFADLGEIQPTWKASLDGGKTYYPAKPKRLQGYFIGDDPDPAVLYGSPVHAFKNLWDSINAKRNNGEYAWKNNPYIWVYEFVRWTEEDQ